jgi:hypothetical protein
MRVPHSQGQRRRRYGPWNRSYVPERPGKAGGNQPGIGRDRRRDIRRLAAPNQRSEE